ncbi:hypothetical protein ACQEVZ_03595 [Dactylosporangium sp. CA-152071]|uniref:hypothetical protein n=1 Tax=Dactylosporangium sp. CA-152071 TaxID=3239933 RepID=UPI003D8FAE65
MGKRHALAVGQLAGVWMLGSVGLPAAVGVVVAAAFAHSTAGLAGGGIVVAGVFLLVLWLIVRATAAASVLGGTTGRQVWWVLLVLGFGVALWGFGWALTDEAGLGVSRDGTLTLLCSGIPFALVAGVLLRGWPARLTAAGTLVALVAAGLVALARSSPALPPAAELPHDPPYVVSIPGYRPTDPSFGGVVGTRTFTPTDPAAIPQPRWITVLAYARQYAVTDPSPCGETAYDSSLRIAECTAEPDGWVYRRGVAEHGYQVTSGQTLVVVAGPLVVDRQVLRAAAATVHPASAAELTALSSEGEEGIFSASSPGYIPRKQGIPPGVRLEPADPAASPQSVVIDVFADLSENTCGAATCTAEPGGLLYRRTDDTHGYVIARGHVYVYAMGGLRVDKALLRQAVLDARPATEEELRRSLPPPPPQPRNAMSRLRDWLRG